MKEQLPHGKNLKLVVFFILGVVTIVLLSFLWKLSMLIARSRFDEIHQFVLEVVGMPDRIVCYSPENNAVSIITIANMQDRNNIGREMSLPIDAHLHVDNASESVSM